MHQEKHDKKRCYRKITLAIMQRTSLERVRCEAMRPMVNKKKMRTLGGVISEGRGAKKLEERHQR